MQFTRGRPYKKDDNAHIEQKNWTHVRRLLGYVRYDTPGAREAINDLYRNELRRFQNLFLPSVKLAHTRLPWRLANLLGAVLPDDFVDGTLALELVPRLTRHAQD